MNVLQPNTSTTSKTPVGQTFKLPGMSIGPQFAGTLSTPVAPKINTTTRTPVQQSGRVVDKSSTQPYLPGMSLKGMSLGITKAPLEQLYKGKQIQIHNPVAQSLIGKPPELFHGSNKVIKAGEEIKPSNPLNPDYVYATRDLPTAAGYAQGRTRLNPDETGNYAIFGTISGVKPSNEQVFKDISEHGKNTDAYISKKYVSTGPTHLVDYTGNVTPLGSNKPVTTRGRLTTPITPRTQSFEQGTLDFGKWTPRETIRG